MRARVEGSGIKWETKRRSIDIKLLYRKYAEMREKGLSKSKISQELDINKGTFSLIIRSFEAGLEEGRKEIENLKEEKRKYAHRAFSLIRRLRSKAQALRRERDNYQDLATRIARNWEISSLFLLLGLLTLSGIPAEALIRSFSLWMYPFWRKILFLGLWLYLTISLLRESEKRAEEARNLAKQLESEEKR